MATTYAASTLEVLAADNVGLERAPVLDRHAPGPGVDARTLSPRASITCPAFMSALFSWPHITHLKTAWLSRFSFAM